MESKAETADEVRPEIRAGKYERVWRNKFLTLDAESLDEMVNELEAAAAELRDLRETGKVWLDDGAGDDYATLYTDDQAIAEAHGFDRVEDEDDEDDEEDDEDDDEEDEDAPDE